MGVIAAVALAFAITTNLSLTKTFFCRMPFVRAILATFSFAIMYPYCKAVFTLPGFTIYLGAKPGFDVRFFLCMRYLAIKFFYNDPEAMPIYSEEDAPPFRYRMRATVFNSGEICVKVCTIK